MQVLEQGRVKWPGLFARPGHDPTTSGTVDVAAVPSIARFLECKIVPSQPLLKIRRTSLTHGALMLYDGEM